MRPDGTIKAVSQLFGVDADGLWRAAAVDYFAVGLVDGRFEDRASFETAASPLLGSTTSLPAAASAFGANSGRWTVFSGLMKVWWKDIERLKSRWPENMDVVPFSRRPVGARSPSL